MGGNRQRQLNRGTIEGATDEDMAIGEDRLKTKTTEAGNDQRGD